ncbi:MAG: hypothetical protein QOG62_2682 [Thermoleophilaceae bacterium]|nr:hypothetical protein [Thermoleophilaceae bacterium]
MTEGQRLLVLGTIVGVFLEAAGVAMIVGTGQVEIGIVLVAIGLIVDILAIYRWVGSRR